MKDIIISLLVLVFIAWLVKTLDLFNSEDNKRFVVLRKIVAPSAISCLTEESLQQISRNLVDSDLMGVNRMVGLGLCSYLAQGTEIFIKKESCASGKAGEIFVGLVGVKKEKFYMSCLVIR